GFFAQFEGLAEWVACIPIPGRERGQDADALAAVARAAGLHAIAAPSLQDALAMSFAYARQPVRVLVCGSLYLAGHMLEINGTPP
ncbi:MAG: bifunctional folylpolyglutamate synthase/dihydrofolate synthase, partial [Alphaproteobacteria bacterium]